MIRGKSSPALVYADRTNNSAALAVDYASAVLLAASDRRVGLLRAYSPAAAKEFADGWLDFVYVDANHSYPAVAADLHAWWPKVRPGGFLAGHDYVDGVIGGSVYGVKTAVADFAREVGLAPAFTVADPPFLSWYIRKPVGPPPSPERERRC